MNTTVPDVTMTIAGAAEATEEQFGVINPATAEVFAHAPAATAAHIEHAMRAADEAFRAWSRDDTARQTGMLRAARVIEEAAGDIAAVLTSEQGKPLRHAAAEVAVATEWLRYFAVLDLPIEVVQDDDNGYAEVQRRPLGVIAAIPPWNYPLALAMWKIAPALRAGNTVVVKPSPYTPLATLLLGEVLRGVLPDGVLNVLSGPDPLGARVAAHPLTRKISFTGSTATGKRVASAAADDLKRVTLELGGNDPAIVLPDANIHEIAESLFWGAFRNNGQVCLAVKRVYVHESQRGDLVGALAAIASSVKVDEGTVPDAMLGPINNAPQLERLTGLVADAIARGARVAAGGKPIDRPGYFYSPTILTDLDDGLAIVDEEQFGPALPVVGYREVNDAIARVNKGNYGLTASVWSDDPERAYRVANEIDAGQVSVNVHGGGVRPDLPFGGRKWSGVGVENGRWGLHAFSETRVISGPPRHQWPSTWFPVAD